MSKRVARGSTVRKSASRVKLSGDKSSNISTFETSTSNDNGSSVISPNISSHDITTLNTKSQTQPTPTPSLPTTTSQQHHHQRTQNAILSIDIGIKNLGFAIFSYDITQRLSSLHISELDLTFDVFDIDNHIKQRLKKDKYDNIVANRCAAVTHFFNTIAKQFNITKVIVERQMHTNTKAMELMYVVVTKAMEHTADVVVFDPKCKFTYINEPYDIKGKKHKRLSIEWARRVLNEWFGDDFVKRFNKHSKRDDIADAINQCIVHLCHDKKVKTGLSRYASVCRGVSDGLNMGLSGDGMRVSVSVGELDEVGEDVDDNIDGGDVVNDGACEDVSDDNAENEESGGSIEIDI